MNIITSKSNEKIKLAVKLKEKKYRDETGLFVIEGKRNVLDSADSLKFVIAKSGEFSETDCEVPVFFVESSLFDKITSTISPEGVLAVASKKQEEETPDCDFLIYLDRIRDPGNLGAIIRTAVAAGYGIMCDDCVDMYNPKTVRSCMSGINSGHFYKIQTLSALKSMGFNIFCADMCGKSVFDENFKVTTGKLCLVIGNEANGIRDEYKALSDNIVCIPMTNMESLNAAVSAGILMYNLKFAKK